jgi:hypothetical protein
VTGPLSLARYRVTLEALEPLELPAYLGSTLRGAFGRAFRRLCCLGRDGESCPAPQLCPYHLIFESAPPREAEALSTHEGIARPFVIAPPPASATDYPPGSVVSFDLTLVGRAREYLPHFVVTFRDMDRIGRGRRRVQLRCLPPGRGLPGPDRRRSQGAARAGRNAVDPVGPVLGATGPADGVGGAGGLR